AVRGNPPRPSYGGPVTASAHGGAALWIRSPGLPQHQGWSMDTRRLFRTASATLLTSVLLLSGCSSDSSDEPENGTTSESARRAGADAKPLKPLPAGVPKNLERYYGQQLTWRSCGLA